LRESGRQLTRAAVIQPPPDSPRGPLNALLIDPEPGFRRILREQLESDGRWRIVEASDVVEGDLAVDPSRPEVLPDLIVVTVLGRAGRAAVTRWRGAGFTGPVIALAAPGGRPVEGASLTIRKPVRLADLLAAIVVLRPGLGARAEPNRGAPIAVAQAVLPDDRNGVAIAASTDETAHQIGPYSFDPATKRLTERARARTIRLTEKEAAMLELLWHAAGTVVARDDLLARVWGYQAGITTHTLETHVYRLRRKIERDPAKAELLVTDIGGYRLVR
jgi:DNA-binding response OmpR family regulator